MMGDYLNDPTVKKTLHIPDSVSWVDADETGPVADGLKSDFTQPCISNLEYLLNKGYRMLMYNGQRDGSLCNHLGNLKTILSLNYSGIDEFKKTNQKLIKLPNGNVLGYIRNSNNFT